MTKQYVDGDNKYKLLKAVQDHLQKVVDKGFDGNLIIQSRKGFLGKVRGVPRETLDTFDPRDEVRQKRQFFLVA